MWQTFRRPKLLTHWEYLLRDIFLLVPRQDVVASVARLYILQTAAQMLTPLGGRVHRGRRVTTLEDPI